MKPGLSPFINDAFDDAHTFLFDPAQADRLARTGCQAAHGRQGKVAQSRALDIGLREIIDAGTQHKAPVLHLLYRPAILQRFEQSMNTAFAHVERTRQVRESQTFLRDAQQIEKTKGNLVIIGSVAGWAASPGASPYAMSKFALRALATAITPELRLAGVTVTLATVGAGFTVIVALAENDPLLTVIVGDPTPAAVTVTAAPVVADRLAWPAFEVPHVSGADGMALLLPSNACAVRFVV